MSKNKKKVSGAFIIKHIRVRKSNRCQAIIDTTITKKMKVQYYYLQIWPMVKNGLVDSALCQVYGNTGNEAPNLEDAKILTGFLSVTTDSQ